LIHAKKMHSFHWLIKKINQVPAVNCLRVCTLISINWLPARERKITGLMVQSGILTQSIG
jgi:hypothetical protein